MNKKLPRIPRVRPLLTIMPTMRTVEPDQLLTLEECADFTGIKLPTWRAWIVQRRVPYVKLGRAVRIKASELQRLITKGEQLAFPAEGRRPSRKDAST